MFKKPKARLQRNVNVPSVPTVVITKKNSLELIDIHKEDIHNKLDERQSIATEHSTCSDLSECETVYTKVSNMHSNSDYIHFPKPNQVLLKALEKLYLQMSQIYQVTTSVASIGDPAASRLLAFVSSVCFDIDLSIRFSIKLNAENDEEVPKRKILLLGSIGKTAMKMSFLARDLLKTHDTKYNRSLFKLGEYCREEKMKKSFASLSKAFAKIGEMSADFSNKLYASTRVFLIEAQSIGLNATSFDSPFLMANRRVDRKSYISFMYDAEENFKIVMNIFQVLISSWNEIKAESLSLNEYEKMMLYLGRLNVDFFSPMVNNFVIFDEKEYMKEGREFNFDFFWKKFEINPNEVPNGNKVQTCIEKKAIQRRYKRGFKFDLNNIQTLQLRLKEGSKKKKKRKFAKKLGF